MLSPTLVYCQLDDYEKQKEFYEAERKYLDEFVERNQHNTLILSIN